MILDTKLTFIHHIQKLKTKLVRHCGFVLKMRHYVPKCVSLKFYNANIKPIKQYGLIVNGGNSFAILNQVLMY